MEKGNGSVGSVVSVPPLDLPDVTIDVEALEDLAKRDEERARELAERAKRAGSWCLTKFGELERAKGLSPRARQRGTAAIDEIQMTLDGFLCHEVPEYRRAAWLAFFTFELGRELSSRQEVEELLGRLIREGRLIEDPAGQLEAYRRTYAVHPDSVFREWETAEVFSLLGSLLNRVFQETGKARLAKSELLRSQATPGLGWKDLPAGKPGKCLLDVPAEKVTQNGETFWRGGGTLLVDSDGEKILPLDASGAIEASVKEACELNVYLLVSSLRYSNPPFIRDLPIEQAKKVQLLWHLIKRGLHAKEENERTKAIKQALADKASVTPEEFFLQGQPGTCLVEYKGTWEERDEEGNTIKQVPNMFFLVNQRIEEGTKRIRIVEVPDHLKEFFAPCMDEYPEEGNRFEGVLHPLRTVLMAVYGQVTSQEATRQITSK